MAASVGSLIFEDARFGGCISFHRAVPVEMVGREIEKQADIRAKSLDEFKLEAAEFGDRNRLVGGFLNHINKRRADISGKKRGEVGVFQNVFDERSGCGFAVGAGDTDQAAVEKSVSEFDFAPDGNLPRARGFEDS